MPRTMDFQNRAAYRRYNQGLWAKRKAGKIPQHPRGKPYQKVEIAGKPHHVRHPRTRRR